MRARRATACPARSIPSIQQEIIDRDLYATAVLSGNRNFDGRIHPYAKQAFLASPAAGGGLRHRRHDPLRHREGRAHGLDANGNARSAWPTCGPSDAEIDADRGPQAVKPSAFPQRSTTPMFAIQDHDTGERRGAACTTGARQSTYIRRPPYWEGALAGERTLRGMRPLALLPDNITTDHLSPSNAIMIDSARRASTCTKHGRTGGRLQFLRHAPRRPPHRAARHVRQPDSQERDGAQRRRQREGRLAGARGARRAR